MTEPGDPLDLDPQDGSWEYREAIIKAVADAFGATVGSESGAGRLVGALAFRGLRIFPEAALRDARQRVQELEQELRLLQMDAQESQERESL